VKLKPEVDLSTFPNIKINHAKDVEKEYGLFCGKWTELLLYDDVNVIDYCHDYPYLPEPYPSPLQSDAFYRKDLLLRNE
jgi:hypothetical protein